MKALEDCTVSEIMDWVTRQLPITDVLYYLDNEEVAEYVIASLGDTTAMESYREGVEQSYMECVDPLDYVSWEQVEAYFGDEILERCTEYADEYVCNLDISDLTPQFEKSEWAAELELVDVLDMTNSELLDLLWYRYCGATMMGDYHTLMTAKGECVEDVLDREMSHLLDVIQGRG